MMNNMFQIKCRDLVGSISKDLGIYRGDDELYDEYVFRMIYSAIGRMAYCTLFDCIDGNREVSLNYFSRRISEYVKSYSLICPNDYFKYNESRYIEKLIRELYEENGLLYYRTLYVRPVPFHSVTYDKISFLRGVSPTKKITISGFGMYEYAERGQQSNIQDLCEFFQVDEPITKPFWKHIFEGLSFQQVNEALPSDVQFLNIENPNNGYWTSRKVGDEMVFRNLERNIYYLCKRNVKGWDIAELPINKYDPYLLINMFLRHIGRLPSSRFEKRGNIVKLHIGFRYPYRLSSLINFYSWPLGDKDRGQFHRVVQADVFGAMKSICEYLGFNFVQE